jgi:hypothetical protein
MHERSLPAKNGSAKDAYGMLSTFYDHEDLRARFQQVDTLPDIQMSIEVSSDSDPDYYEHHFNPRGLDVETQVRKWHREARRACLEEACSDTTEPEYGSGQQSENFSDYDGESSDSDEDDPPAATIQLATANDILKTNGNGTAVAEGDDDPLSDDDNDGDKELSSSDDESDSGSDNESEFTGTTDDNGTTSQGASTEQGRSFNGDSTTKTDDWEDGLSAAMSRKSSARSKQTARTLQSQSQLAVQKEMQLLMLKRDRPQRCKITVSSPGKCVRWKQNESCMIAWTCYHVAVSHVSIQVKRCHGNGVFLWNLEC